MPPAARLIKALASVRDAHGNSDYTRLVDGYGLHIYPTSDTTLDMVKGATDSISGAAPFFPQLAEKPLWITEWNVTGSSSWNGKAWYFQYTKDGQVGGDLNKADARGAYPAMSRAEAIRTFQTDAILRLKSSRTDPVNIGYLLYYSYDSAWKSSQCAHAGFNRAHGLEGLCFDGVIDPATGDLLGDVAAAVMNRR
jgi:hypothetical protein